MNDLYRLLDVCDFQGGTQPPKNEWKKEKEPGYIRMLQIRDYSQDSEKYAEYVKDSKKLHKCKKDDIMLSRYGYIGQAFMGLEGAYNVALVKVIKLIDIDTNYLLYYFKSKMFQHYLLSNVGARATIPGFNKSELEDAKIKVPLREEQLYISGVLRKIEEIIKKREKELRQMDELIKTRFVELFGDLNDKKWKEEQLGELCEQLKRYPTFCNMEYLENGVRVIRIGNILLDGHMDEMDDNYVYVYDEVNKDFPDTVIEMDDIVMAVRGDGSAAKRIGIVREDKLIGSNISPNLIRIKADSKKVLPVYLFYYLTGDLGQKRLDAYVNKTAKKNIAAKDIAKVLVPVPDFGVQNEFISFVKQVDKSKVVVKKSLEEVKTLFDSLMQKYFG